MRDIFWCSYQVEENYSALVGAFSVITNLRMELFQALVPTLNIGSSSSSRRNAPNILFIKQQNGKQLTGHWGRDTGDQICVKL